MEAENDGFHEGSPFPGCHFQVPGVYCWLFRNPKQPPKGCTKPVVNNEKNYQPPLVQDFWTINSIFQHLTQKRRWMEDDVPFQFGWFLGSLLQIFKPFFTSDGFTGHFVASWVRVISEMLDVFEIGCHGWRKVRKHQPGVKWRDQVMGRCWKDVVFFRTPVNQHSHGKSTICRCISYWKRWISIAMLVHRRVTEDFGRCNFSLRNLEVWCVVFGNFEMVGSSENPGLMVPTPKNLQSTSKTSKVCWTLDGASFCPWKIGAPKKRPPKVPEVHKRSNQWKSQDLWLLVSGSVNASVVLQKSLSKIPENQCLSSNVQTSTAIRAGLFPPIFCWRKSHLFFLGIISKI